MCHELFFQAITLVHAPPALLRILDYVLGKVLAGTNSKPTATVTVYDSDKQEEGTLASLGTGPVDASYKAIDGLIGVEGTKLLEYSVARYEALKSADFE